MASSEDAKALSGGRALAVARLMSLGRARASALSVADATALLGRYEWDLREADAAARADAARARGSLRPVPRVVGAGAVRAPHEVAALRNVVNAGNSCYADAVLAAAFAQWDAYDGLVRDGGADTRVRLAEAVRVVVDAMRAGETASAKMTEAVRAASRSAGFATRRGQEDAAEWFVFLVDSLGAPFLALGENLLHDARASSSSSLLLTADDERVSTERLLWLSLPSEPRTVDAPVPLTTLVDSYFLGDQLRGLRRHATTVDAWKARRLLPEYTPLRETGEVAAINDAAAFPFRAVSVPFALKRYDASGRSKARARVTLPPVIPFTDHVEPPPPSTATSSASITSASAARTYSLVLRSVVCHIGHSLNSGHYIAYTYDAFGTMRSRSRAHTPRAGREWTRWNDLKHGGVEYFDDGRLPDDVRDHLERDSYLVFYELVPGNGSADPRDAFFHVPDVDVSALAADDFAFAEALQRIEFDEIAATFLVVDEC